MDMLVSHKKKLKTISNKLKRYCHAEGCSNFKECPEDCCRESARKDGVVDPMLNMDTAVAWITAREISFFLYDYENKHFHRMSAMDDIRRLSSTKANYPELTALLEDMWNIMIHYYQHYE
jgi:hypothetical protein